MGRLTDLIPAVGLGDGAISLRLWTIEDAGLVVAAGADPEVVRWTNIPEQVNGEDAARLVDETIEQCDQGWRAAFVITEPGDPIGHTSLRVNWRVHTGELGYWLLDRARGHGFATQAVRLVRDWALATVGLARLQAGIEPDN